MPHPRVEPPYDLSPHRTVLIGIDFQQAFGEGAWEHVPGASAAIDNFRVAARSWRSAGGRVVLIREAYTPEDFPDAIRDEIARVHPLMLGSVNCEFHPDLLVDGDLTSSRKASPHSPRANYPPCWKTTAGTQLSSAV